MIHSLKRSFCLPTGHLYHGSSPIVFIFPVWYFKIDFELVSFFKSNELNSVTVYNHSTGYCGIDLNRSLYLYSGHTTFLALLFVDVIDKHSHPLCFFKESGIIQRNHFTFIYIILCYCTIKVAQYTLKYFLISAENYG